jgi:hypothetical protein
MQPVQSAYSHGLEAIYAIETIDVSSIRPLERHSPTTTSKAQKASVKNKPLTEPLQLEFDFGDEYRGWIESFILREPIHALELSWHAEKCLVANGKKTVGDLAKATKQDFVFLKGMGQGHIDEVQRKLQEYLEGKQLERCYVVDLGAWVRSLFVTMDRKKAFVGLNAYQLEQLFTVAPAESVEINRLSAEKRQEWLKEVLINLRTDDKKQSITKDMNRIVDVFIKPWLRMRHDLANQQELMERFLRVSDKANRPTKAFSFISSVYFDEGFPVAHYLHKADEGLYCSNAETVCQYQRLIEKASTYFYNPTVCYVFPHLVQLLARDFAMNWEGFNDGFIEKALRQSPRFRVRKGDAGVLMVRLA